MNFSKRKVVYDDLEKYDITAPENSFIEVTIWTNSEGYDITINSHSDKNFSLTTGEFGALKKLIKALDKHFD